MRYHIFVCIGKRDGKMMRKKHLNIIDNSDRQKHRERVREIEREREKKNKKYMGRKKKNETE